jgi:hypothetical protein
MGPVRRRIPEAMKGDRVEVVVDTGGSVARYEIEASRNGRRVEISVGRGIVEVTEVTRSGQPVRSGRFMSSRVVAMVEHKARDGLRPSAPLPVVPEPPP